MAPGTALSLVGLAVQLLGAVVAIWGLIKTHDAYADKTIRAMLAERLDRATQRVSRSLDRLLRRPVRPVSVSGSITMDATLSANVSGYGLVTISPDMSPEDAIAELDRRTQRLFERVADLDQSTKQSLQEQAEALRAMRAELEAADHEADIRIRQAAIEGLMTEAVGLVFVIVGGLIQGIGTYVAAQAS